MPLFFHAASPTPSICKFRVPARVQPQGLIALAVASAFLLSSTSAGAAPQKSGAHAKSAAAHAVAKPTAARPVAGKSAGKAAGSAANGKAERSAPAKQEMARALSKSGKSQPVAAKGLPAKSVASKPSATKSATANSKAMKNERLAGRAMSARQLAKHAARQSHEKRAAQADAKAPHSVSYALRQPSPMRGFAAQQNLYPRLRVESEEPPVPHVSFGELAGLRSTPDALDLKSSVALVVDQETNQVLLRKNDSAVLPIASLTKLMTGLIISEARLPLDEQLTIEQEDVDTEKHSRSRLRVGTTLSRGELLHLALMSSENRAAHALGRTYPGGISRFVAQMNARAAMLGMHDTRYVEPTGLSSANQSSALDLATLVGAAYKNALVRELSTSPSYELEVGSRLLQFNNTNRLVNNPEWEIGLQKTGYIAEAGQCLVMQARIAGRKLIMVFLDSTGKLSRIGDAERVRRWIESNHPSFPSLRTSGGMSISGG